MVGMAKAAADKVPAARKLFDTASAVLGYDLLDVCVNGPPERLNDTVVSLRKVAEEATSTRLSRMS